MHAHRFMVINPILNLLQALAIDFFPLYPETEAHKAVVERQKKSFRVPGTSAHSVRRFSTMQPGGLGGSSNATVVPS